MHCAHVSRFDTQDTQEFFREEEKCFTIDCRIIRIVKQKRAEECPCTCNIACNLDKVIWQSCVPNHYLIISFNFAGLRYNLSSSISQQHQPGLIPTVSAPGSPD